MLNIYCAKYQIAYYIPLNKKTFPSLVDPITDVISCLGVVCPNSMVTLSSFSVTVTAREQSKVTSLCR